MGWNDTAPGSSPQEMVRPHRLPPGSRAGTGPVFPPFETTEALLSDSLEKENAWANLRTSVLPSTGAGEIDPTQSPAEGVF